MAFAMPEYSHERGLLLPLYLVQPESLGSVLLELQAPDRQLLKVGADVVSGVGR